MKARSTTYFTKAILLVLLTSAHPSLEDANYDPSAFSDWSDLRDCVQWCLGEDIGNSGLGCTVNNCYCRADIIPQADSFLSTCVSSQCSGDTNDVVSATSFYLAYCASATNTASISLITNNAATAAPGSTVTGSITAPATQTATSGGNTNNNNNNNIINVGKSSADGLSNPSKIAIGVSIPLVVLVVAGFLWSIGDKREQWEIKPELGASEAQRPDVWQGGMGSTMAHQVGEVPSVSLPELHGTRRNIVEGPDNPVYELYNTRI